MSARMETPIPTNSKGPDPLSALVAFDVLCGATALAVVGGAVGLTTTGCVGVGVGATVVGGVAGFGGAAAFGFGAAFRGAGAALRGVTVTRGRVGVTFVRGRVGVVVRARRAGGALRRGAGAGAARFGATGFASGVGVGAASGVGFAPKAEGATSNAAAHMSTNGRVVRDTRVDTWRENPMIPKAVVLSESPTGKKYPGQPFENATRGVPQPLDRSLVSLSFRTPQTSVFIRVSRCGTPSRNGRKKGWRPSGLHPEICR